MRKRKTRSTTCDPSPSKRVKLSLTKDTKDSKAKEPQDDKEDGEVEDEQQKEEEDEEKDEAGAEKKDDKGAEKSNKDRLDKKAQKKDTGNQTIKSGLLSILAPGLPPLQPMLLEANRRVSQIIYETVKLEHQHVLRQLEAKIPLHPIDLSSLNQAMALVSRLSKDKPNETHFQKPKNENKKSALDQLKLTYELYQAERNKETKAEQVVVRDNLRNAIKSSLLEWLTNAKNHVMTNFEPRIHNYIWLELPSLLAKCVQFGRDGKTHKVWDDKHKKRLVHEIYIWSTTSQEDREKYKYKRLFTFDGTFQREVDDFVRLLRLQIGGVVAKGASISDGELQRNFVVYLPWFYTMLQRIEQERLFLQQQIDALKIPDAVRHKSNRTRKQIKRQARSKQTTGAQKLKATTDGKTTKEEKQTTTSIDTTLIIARNVATREQPVVVGEWWGWGSMCRELKTTKEQKTPQCKDSKPNDAKKVKEVTYKREDIVKYRELCGRLRRCRLFAILPERRPQLLSLAITNTTLAELLSFAAKHDRVHTKNWKTVQKTFVDAIKGCEKMPNDERVKTLDQAWSAIFDLHGIHNIKNRKTRQFAHHIRTDSVSASVLFFNHKRGSNPSKYEKKRIAKQERGKHADGRLSTYEVKHHEIYAKAERVVAIDPGRRDLAVGVTENKSRNDEDEKHKVIRISNANYRHMSGTLAHTRKINGLIKNDQAVRQFTLHAAPTAKTTSSAQYMIHLRHQFKHLTTNFAFYSKHVVLKQRQKAYIRKTQALDRACKRIIGDPEERSNHRKRKKIRPMRHKPKKTLVLFGDASVSGVSRGHAPAPNLGLKRRLQQHADVIMVNEHRTSKVCSCDQCEGKWVAPLRRADGREVHGVRVCQASKTCWNRDVNAARNILHVFQHSMKTNGGHLKAFRHSEKRVACRGSAPTLSS